MTLPGIPRHMARSSYRWCGPGDALVAGPAGHPAAAARRAAATAD